MAAAAGRRVVLLEEGTSEVPVAEASKRVVTIEAPLEAPELVSAWLQEEGTADMLHEVEEGFATLNPSLTQALDVPSSEVWVYDLHALGAAALTNITVLFRGSSLAEVAYGVLLLDGCVIDVLAQAADSGGDDRVAEFPAFASNGDEGYALPTFALGPADSAAAAAAEAPRLQVALVFKRKHGLPHSSVRVLADAVLASPPRVLTREAWRWPLPRVSAFDAAAPELRFEPDGGRLTAEGCAPWSEGGYMPPAGDWPPSKEEDWLGTDDTAVTNGVGGLLPPPPSAAGGSARQAALAQARAIIQSEVDAEVALGLQYVSAVDAEGGDVTLEYAMRFHDTLADRLDAIVAWRAQRVLLREQLAAFEAAQAAQDAHGAVQAAPPASEQTAEVVLQGGSAGESESAAPGTASA